MALTRNFLKSMGLNDEQISAIIEGHNDTVEGLKSKIQAQEDGAKTLAEAQAEVARLTGELEKAQKNSGDAAKVQADFDAYKSQVELDKANGVKKAALRKVLKSAGVARDEFADLLLAQVDLGNVEMDGDAVKSADKLIAPLKESYAGCFAQENTQGVPPASPPSGGGKLSGNAAFAAEIARKYHAEHYGSAPERKGE